MTSEVITTNNKFNILKILASTLHANINIKGGNIFQDEIFKVIRDSNKHISVKQEHKINLLLRENNKRKYHKVDILIEDENRIIAINSKGKSFNNTKSEDSELHEYNWYLDSLKNLFPSKKCEYWIFKDEYDNSDSRMGVYHYLNTNGIPVFNTEKYLVQHYGCDFSIIENRRQERALAECEKELVKYGFTTEMLYACKKN